LVVPGAVGAWRTEAVRKAGLFSGNTVTEDADLTVAVHRAGYRVVFQEQARSVTEAPASVRDFMRQRLRWTFGMLQTSWKHRGATAEGRTVGYISIVDAIWFGVFSSLFAPLVDLLLVVLLMQGTWAIAANDVALIASVPPALILAYFALTALDVINTIVAFWFEKRFDWRLLLLVPFLRFGYRQLLYISTIRALVQAMTGTVACWNKLDRTGSALSLWSPAGRKV
jgi:cellulose synthase/poly-beta-1,6-N-acetylglucosamine synthase-like glycosyltransferase